jgi:hypothetical protein
VPELEEEPRLDVLQVRDSLVDSEGLRPPDRAAQSDSISGATSSWVE